MALCLIGCMAPPNIPDLVTITPSQTAFVIPLEGQTSNQGSFDSEAFLNTAKVATKRITIPKRWRDLGRGAGNGEWIPTATVIIVERRPVSQHFNTANKNPITAESKESIGFDAGIACTAQIDESEAAKFLYRYNNKKLEDVMGDEILNRVRSKFVELCSKYNLADLLVHKSDIMDAIRSDVTPYFKERGITITSIGLIGEFSYLSEEIQTSINKKFQAQQDLIAQKAVNEKVISKAEADAKAAQILNNPNALKLKELELQSRFIEKWTGVPPNAIGSNSLFSMPFQKG